MAVPAAAVACQDLWRKFGYGIQDPGRVPSSLVPGLRFPGHGVWTGPGGDLLLPLPEGDGDDAGRGADGLPYALLAVRGETAFEYRRAPRPEATTPLRFRLSAIRSSSGETLFFTYGENGDFFEATLGPEHLRVALAGLAATGPVPALGLWAPEGIYRNTEARLRVTYDGLPGNPEFSVTAMVDPAGVDACPDRFWSNLQVTRIIDESTGESVAFGYGKPAQPLNPGPALIEDRMPAVVREITLPGRTLVLEWAGCRNEAPGGTRFEVAALKEGRIIGHEFKETAPAYRRIPTGARESLPAVPPAWVRQARHFILGLERQVPTPCRTHIRDHWNLMKSEPDIGSTPTFEVDGHSSTLRPVAGRLTRQVTWTEGTRPEDVHDSGRPGLKGGSGFGPNVRMGPVRYDPVKREATLESFSGLPPLGASGRVMTPEEAGRQGTAILANEIAKNMQSIRETSQRASGIQAGLAAALASTKALETQQTAQRAMLDEQMRSQLKQQAAQFELWKLQSGLQAEAERKAQVQRWWTILPASLQSDGIPPLTQEEREGSKPRYNRSGDPLGVDRPPLKPRADQDVVILVSRPVMGALGILVSHTATIIQTKGRDYIVQSGHEEGTGVNLASMEMHEPGQGLYAFIANTATHTTHAKWFVPVGKMTEGRITAGIKEWNDHRVRYFEDGHSLPKTTCNTFTRWFDRFLGLKLPSDMPNVSLYGWSGEIDVEP